jgi:hypothetical protein
MSITNVNVQMHRLRWEDQVSRCSAVSNTCIVINSSSSLDSVCAAQVASLLRDAAATGQPGPKPAALGRSTAGRGDLAQPPGEQTKYGAASTILPSRHHVSKVWRSQCRLCLVVHRCCPLCRESDHCSPVTVSGVISEHCREQSAVVAGRSAWLQSAVAAERSGLQSRHDIAVSAPPLSSSSHPP